MSSPRRGVLMTKLKVELYGTIIGELAGDDRRSIDFTVSDQALERAEI